MTRSVGGGGRLLAPDYGRGVTGAVNGQLATNERGHVCLSFDFDGPSLWMQRRMTTPDPVSRGEFGAVAVPRILRLLARRGIPATFFIPGHTIETYPDACRMIVDAGCEVGLHGYAHELNTTLSEDEERVGDDPLPGAGRAARAGGPRPGTGRRRATPRPRRSACSSSTASPTTRR